MARRNTSSATDEEIFGELRALRRRLGHLPAPADLNSHREFPLNASGLRRRFGSLYRALLLAGVWFRQPHGVPHEPLAIDNLPLTPLVRGLLDSDGWQVLHLNGLGSVEDVLRERFSRGHPVGGMFSPVTEGTPLYRSPVYGMWLHATSLRLIEVTASARAYELVGELVLENGTRYCGVEVPVAMIIVYDLNDRGWVFDGRLILPESVDLGSYVLANNPLVRA